MKSRKILTCMTAMTLFSALAVPIRLAAQSHYSVVERAIPLQRSRARRTRWKLRRSQWHKRSGLGHRHRQPAGKLDHGRYSLGKWNSHPSGYALGGTE